MKKITEFIKYSFIGGITTALNLGLFIILEKCGLNYIIANTIAYVIAVIFNFILSKKYVFNLENQNKYNSINEFIRFAFVRILSLIVDNGVFYICVDLLHINVYISRITISFVIIILTFAINKLFVFKFKADQ